MVTTDQYAALSANVYQDAGAPDGWTRLQLDPPRTETGFYGAAYQNAAGEIVIAFRGMERTDRGDRQAVAAIARGEVPAQFAAAMDFYQQVLETYGSTGAPITFTGHSLGGALAQMVVGRNFLSSAVTFGAPGALALFPKIGANPNGSYNITNYVATTDPIGNMGPHAGTTERVTSLPAVLQLVECAVQHRSWTCGPAFLANSHAMKNYRAQFAGARTMAGADPLVLDLDGDGIETRSATAGASFDHDRSGFAEQSGWVGADTLIGYGASGDVISGLWGDDVLDRRGGDDVLDGRPGARGRRTRLPADPVAVSRDRG